MKEKPQFDTYHLDNHTVQLGAIAFLPCTIKNLGNKSVRNILLYMEVRKKIVKGLNLLI